MNSSLVFYNKTINKKELKTIIHSTFESYGMVKTTKLVEVLKKSGFGFATQAGISISIEDLKVPPTKDSLFLKNEKLVNQTYFSEKCGNINEVERFQKVIDTWHTTSNLLKEQLIDFFKAIDPLNPVYMMAFSGARGNLSQVRQLVGMRGLMADPKGQLIDLPIKANFREGLTITDYVISSYGARKGIVDTALRTADSGYLTRRLVDVAQHIIIRELDCETRNGIRVSFNPHSKKNSYFIGRILGKSVMDKQSNNCIIKSGTELTNSNLSKITFYTDLILRSPLICESNRSICQKCYGWNLANGKIVDLADAVGIIAAQSIGEPGTQLTMRTFHTGGVFTGETSNQIRSHCTATVLFSSDFKAVLERNSYGEVILKARTNTKIFLLTNEKKLISIPVKIGMLIFVRNKSVIKRGELLAEIPQYNKQTVTQRKTIKSKISGEIQFQNFRLDQNSSTSNSGIIWIASGDVYSILPNMLVKKTGSKIVKNNSLAQSKVTLPVSGFIKKKESSAIGNLSIIDKLFNLKPDALYVENRFYYLWFGQNLFFKLADKIKREIQGFTSFAKSVVPFSTFEYSSNVYYSNKSGIKKNLITNFGVCLLIPFVKVSVYDLSNFSCSEFTELYNFDKVILFPGEILFNEIKIDQLSYCEILFHPRGKTVFLRIKPIVQYLISNISKPNLKIGLNIFDESINFNFVTGLNLNDKTSFLSNQYFIATYIGFWDFYTINSCKFLGTKSSIIRKSAFNFLIKYEIPRSLFKDNKLISFLVSNNQYIHPYTVIITLNSIVNKTTSILSMKNLYNDPSRFLVSKLSNYAIYNKITNPKIFNSKFIIIGDCLKSNDRYSDHSGYRISDSNEPGLKLRISLPIFISLGTKVFVRHGGLIQQGDSLCEVIYTRSVSDDIITGLPRIESLLEARNRDKKDLCDLIKSPGIVKENIDDDKLVIIEKRDIRIYKTSHLSIVPMRKGQIVFVAQPLQLTAVNPHKVLEVYFKYYCSLYNPERAAKYSIGNIQFLLLNLIQEVYHSQGIQISDKHVEVIIRQITSKVKISNHKVDTFFVLRDLLDFDQVRYINIALKTTNKALIEYEPLLVGITKVALLAESFVSAASFQETTRILAQAAIEGRVEWLRGLKENVILGRLIPAGTGFKAFNSTSLLNIRFRS